MKILASISLLSLLGMVLLGTEPAEGAELPPVKTFIACCNERNSLSAETRKTVDLLLQAVHTTDCRSAEIELNKRTEFLSSSPEDIIDLRPFESLTNITKLSFISDKIIDISPVAKLKNLEFFGVYSNQLTDVRPVAKLKKLTSLLLLMGQKVTNIQVIEQLSNLQDFTLWYGLLRHAKPLRSMPKLTTIELRSADVVDLRILVNLKSLSSLKVVESNVTNV